MNLSKAQREKLKQRYGGHCAYCGCLLGARWQADHFEPVNRYPEYVMVPGLYGGLISQPTGRMLMGNPERDVWENLRPACLKCNNDKGPMSIERWRAKLQRGPEVLARNYATYQHSLRFGLIQPTGKQVIFYFERYKRPRVRLEKQ